MGAWHVAFKCYAALAAASPMGAARRVFLPLPLAALLLAGRKLGLYRPTALLSAAQICRDSAGGYGEGEGRELRKPSARCPLRTCFGKASSFFSRLARWWSPPTPILPPFRQTKRKVKVNRAKIQGEGCLQQPRLQNA